MNRGRLSLFLGAFVACAFTVSYVYFQFAYLAEQSLFKTISVVDAKAMQESISSLLIVDVRSEQEYSQRHLKGAINIPLSVLNDRVRKFDRNLVVLVYCDSGRRSPQACLLFAKAGFTNVYNMEGGMTKWVDSGYPTVS